MRRNTKPHHTEEEERRGPLCSGNWVITTNPGVLPALSLGGVAANMLSQAVHLPWLKGHPGMGLPRHQW